MRKLTLSLAFLFFVLNTVLRTAAWGEEYSLTLRLQWRGQEIEGKPIKVSDKAVTILARDGSLWDIDPREATNYHKTADSFQPYSLAELRGRLLREFGKGYDVTGAGPYLVVHPMGQGSKWGPRFEELYRSFIPYFSTRGLQYETPKFPLIAVVFARQLDFMQHSAKEGIPASNGVLGYYTPRSNRILMYDSASNSGAKPNSDDWRTNAETIIHEASHQVAFNTGIHSRFVMPPRWLAEGLGSLFEARGVWNSRENGSQSDRLNKLRLDSFRSLLKHRKPGSLADLVSYDRVFQTNVDAAYAESWALTFFLTETEPRKYADYLKLTVARDPNKPYTPQERLKDFLEVFGPNLPMLEARYLRYVADLK